MKAKIKNAAGKLLAVALVPMVAGGMFTSITASANIGDTLDPDKKYSADYSSFSETLKSAAELNLELMSEGAILLKNDGALPLQTSAKNKTKVTVLGADIDSFVTGGGGSGSQNKPGYGETPAKAATVYDGLKEANFEYNPAVTKTNSSGHYMQKVDGEQEGSVSFAGNHYVDITDGTGTLNGVSIDGYDDTAILVFARSGAEGSDNKSYNVDNMEDVTDHALCLNISEKEMVAYAKKHFKKIIVLINSPSVMEVGELEDDEAIDAILCVGQTGWNGMISVGKILNGEVNPSGRTVDYWMRDFATDPTWYNVGDYSQANAIITGNGTTPYKEKSTVQMGYDPAYAMEGIDNGSDYHMIDYAEGIYMGYRYYETAYAELEKAADKETADKWYQSATAYPFGYGLSYTTFTQTIKSVEGDLSAADGKITVTVTVKNTGDVAGKDVVQLYSTPPYKAGEVEKAAVNLVAFEKTDMLAAGASEDVKLTVNAKDLASFDYNDANHNNNSGYEVEAGSYVLSVRNNSHDVFDSKTISAESLLTWDEDGNPETPNNIFSQEEGVWEMYNTQATHWTVNETEGYLSRTDLVNGTGAAAVVALEEEYSAGQPNALQEKLGWLLANDGKDNLFKKEAFNHLNTQYNAEAAYEDYDNHLTAEVETDYKNVWTKTNEDIPTSWTQGAGVKNNGLYGILLADMKGVPLDDAKWVEFMNQFTWEELVSIGGNEVNPNDGYGSKEVDSIGQPRIYDHDGPGQMKHSQGYGPGVDNSKGNGYAYVSESVIGSTWNKELAYRQGRMVGNESIFLNVNGWYGPGANIHRDGLAGRNFEYYSQDGVQGGHIMAAVVRGATDMGVHVYMKHAFLNDQETGRMGLITFVTEQAIREIYAKIYEIAVKEGNANGMMVACNRIGLSSSASYGIAVQMYYNEWGFDGTNISDAYIKSQSGTTGWDSEVMVRGYIRALNSGLAAFPSAETLEGVWDATLRDGKGGVKVKGSASATTEDTESATQYYFTRMTAMHALYTHANSNVIKDTPVTYNVNVPGYSVDIVLASGDTVGSLVSPVAAVKGYKFIGWSATADGELLADDAAIPETLYANFEEYPPIAIIDGTFWINGEDTGISPEGQVGVGIQEIKTSTVDNGTVVTIVLTNGESTSFTIPNGATGEQGAQGPQGPEGPQGPQGEAGKGGCGSSIGAYSGMMALVAAMVVVGAVITVRKVKKN